MYPNLYDQSKVQAMRFLLNSSWFSSSIANFKCYTYIFFTLTAAIVRKQRQIIKLVYQLANKSTDIMKPVDLTYVYINKIDKDFHF